MEPLVTVETAKVYLRLLGTDFDAELAIKVVTATGIVIDYIKQPDHGWTDETVPPEVQAVIYEVVRNLMEGGDPLPQKLKDIVWRHRDPALA
jgi:hypothetical protein